MSKIKLHAAIDVGSHDIRMKIAELAYEQPPRVVESIRRTLAIGTDTYLQGSITQPVLDECKAILSDMQGVLKNYPIGSCRTVATSAFREARNAAFAVDQIRRSANLDIEILSNAEEQHYHILAAVSQLPDFAEYIKSGTLLVNIGAGSVQLTAYNQRERIFSQNMLIGSLRIRELLADLERRTADFAGLMEEYISSDLDFYHLLEPGAIAYQHLIIVGGEMDYLKRLAGQNPDQVSELTAKQFGQLYRRLLATRPVDLAAAEAFPVEHASLLLPLALIVRKVISFTGAKSFIVPPATLCDGILVEMASERYDFRLPYDQQADILSVCRYLARRFEADHRHAGFVEHTALQLFDETARLHGLPDRCRVLLQAAAILHDCGKSINLARHSIRSQEIIEANEIVGLDRAEQAVVAWAARMHSGTSCLEEPAFLALDPADRLRTIKLAALLRLADALDNGHKQKISGIAVSLTEQELVITVTTHRDITLEVWDFENKSQLFQDIFGLKPRIKVRKQMP
jgi:exopolyphosphatase / guanosine-5'-triphosphate,3'-diphosphate pyrophosphatase